MDHFYIVPRASFSNPVAAWFTHCLGSGGLEDVFNMGHAAGATTRHKRWAISGTFFTSGYTRANEKEPFSLKLLAAAIGVREVRIATIDDDVPFAEMRDELSDEIVNSITSFYEENDFARCFQLLAEFFNRMSSLYLGPCGRVSRLALL